MILDITPEQLQRACNAVYSGNFVHAPAQMFMDHYRTANPPTTFLRVSFPEKFTHAAACKLDQLRTKLQAEHGRADIVFVCYYEYMHEPDMVSQSIKIHDR